MDALLSAFVAAGLGEWGDRTQLLVLLLAARTGRPLTILAGLAAASIVSSVAVAWLGFWVASIVTPQAMAFLLALALLFAGIAGLMRREAPSADTGRTPLLIAAFLLCLSAEIGDRSQFLTFALAGELGSPGFAAAGASTGILAAAIPAALLGNRLQAVMPVRAIRLGGAVLFLLAGFVVTLLALQLS
jgi:Ca2+/H+ antiporter, TMEM165/GDT1 family